MSYRKNEKINLEPIDSRLAGFQTIQAKDQFIKKVLLVLLSTILMGFALSFLNRTSFGTDPFSALNLGIAQKLHILFGTWQLIINLPLLIIVLLANRKKIGIGTVANMVIVGYSMDFFTWLEGMVIQESYFSAYSIRVLVLIPALILFIFAAALYMAVDIGTSPYDAVPMILGDCQDKVSFRTIRIFWDVTATILAVLVGGNIGIVTIVTAFALGPVITVLKKNLQKIL